METQIAQWLIDEGFSDDNIPISFVRNYEEKVPVATSLNVELIIDDKVQVLQHFVSENIVTCWWQKI
jgi:hypothetical protein